MEKCDICMGKVVDNDPESNQFVYKCNDCGFTWQGVCPVHCKDILELEPIPFRSYYVIGAIYQDKGFFYVYFEEDPKYSLTASITKCSIFYNKEDAKTVLKEHLPTIIKEQKMNLPEYVKLEDFKVLFVQLNITGQAGSVEPC
jgi:hypothetical protein